MRVTGVFLLSCYGVNARDVVTPNLLLGVLIFFGGVCQFIRYASHYFSPYRHTNV